MNLHKLYRIFTGIISTLLLTFLTVCIPQKKTFGESFVEVSFENPSYFCLSNKDTYIPVGLNICWARNMDEMERMFRLLSENGGNFARIWLGHSMFEYETVYGQANEDQLIKVDKILNIAEKYNIKVKMCLEQFRTITPETKGFNNKWVYHIDNGGPFTSMYDYMSDERGQNVFLKRVMFFKNRYGDDPRIFAWEIWNEMNAITISFSDKEKLLIPWNAAVLPQMKEIFPKNLITQSMGSMDNERWFPQYEGIMRIPENDLVQVHRYIDEGATLPICQAPMDLLASDAIKIMQSYRIPKPILLAEIGAVKPGHTGPHQAYDSDRDGMILHDLLFAPYFSGAAGPGHAWHWDNYVDRNNIWFQFRRFANAIENIDPVKESFLPLRSDQSNFRVYALKGSKHTLVWIRDTENTWQSELIDRIEPKLNSNVLLNLSNILKDKKVSKIDAYDPWTDQWMDVKATALVTLPDFKRSIVLKIY